MPIPPTRWTEVTPSEHEWERDALAWLRDRLPDHEPWRAWSNFEFLADDGSHNEVDLLVVGRTGVWLIEIKSHPGVVTGDQGTLHVRAAPGDPGTPDGFRATFDHPIHACARKAKRLKSLLERTASFGGRLRAPWIESLVFFSEATRIEIDAPAHHQVVMKDPEDAGGTAAPARPGILDALLHRRGPGIRTEPRSPGDKPLAKALAKALESDSGIARRRAARVGEYELEAKLDEAATWQDFHARHRGMDGRFGRIRRYLITDDVSARELDDTPLARERLQAAARREIELLDRLDHPGILRARDFLATDPAPCLLFEPTPPPTRPDGPGWLRLDRYLDAHGDRLDDEARLGILRDVADAVQFAHGQHLRHRALSPQAVLIQVGTDGRPQSVKVHNWSAGSLSGTITTETTSGHLHATIHGDRYQDDRSAVYAAPELDRDPACDQPTVDVFSLGCLAWLLFVGRPPAGSRGELLQVLGDDGLDPTGDIDAVPALERLIHTATQRWAAHRYPGIEDFLDELEDARRAIAGDPSRCDDPATAEAGQSLHDGTRILERLGRGSCAVAFRVQLAGDDPGDGGHEAILKVALDDDAVPRLAAERAALARLDHDHLPRLIRPLHRDPDGSADADAIGFYTRPPSRQTLRQMLERDGALHAEFLERFGEQLLSGLVHIEEQGVIHRDIKPDNIAITDYGRNQALSLVLFDFSLAATPWDDLRAGTPAYADPFLAERPSRRWDLAAERFSAALTLHEMATGSLPRWGSPGAAFENGVRQADQAPADAEAILSQPPLTPDLRERLEGFLRRGLARDPRFRFASAEEMLNGWRAVFHRTEHGPEVDVAGEDELDAAVDALLAAEGPTAELSSLPLSTRGQNALARMNCWTLRELAEWPSNLLFTVRGVGRKTQNELDRVARRLRTRMPDLAIDARAARRRMNESNGEDGGSAARDRTRDLPASTDPDLLARIEAAARPEASIEEILDALLIGGATKKTQFTKAARAAAEALLGVTGNAASPDAAPDGFLPPAPTSADVARELGVSRQRVYQVVRDLRVRWSNHPAVETVLAELVPTLARAGGILELDEAAARMLAARPSSREADPADPAAPLRIARAVVRAACEAEAEPGWARSPLDALLAGDDADRDAITTEPRFALRRRGERSYLAADDALVPVAELLAQRATKLAAANPPASSAEVEAALAAVSGATDLEPRRRVQLAAAAAGPAACLGPAGTLYPAGLDAGAALRGSAHLLGGLGERDERQPGRRVIDPLQVTDRVRRAFPHASPLPAPPELARLLQSIGWEGCTWDEAAGVLVVRTPDAVTVGSASTVPHRFVTAEAVDTKLDGSEARPEDRARAREFEDTLVRTVQARGFLVVRTSPKFYEAAWHELQRRLNAVVKPAGALQVVDLDELVIDLLDTVLEARNVKPELFEDADAEGPEGRHWSKVQVVVADVAKRTTEALDELSPNHEPLLLRNVGLLARWDHLEVVRRLNPQASDTRSLQRGVVVLVPGTPGQSSVRVDGHALDLVGSTQLADAPDAWVRNLHQAATST